MDDEIELINALKMSDKEKIKGDLIHRVKKSFEISEGEKIQILDKTIQSINEQYQKTIKNLTKKTKELAEPKHYPRILKKDKLDKVDFANVGSKIVTDFDRVSSFFDHPVTEFKFLYRATDSKFMIKEFFDKGK